MKWITIETVDNKGKKTDVFEVYTKPEKTPLGLIKWKASWRKYAFFPYPDTCFEQTCMRDISDFIENTTKEYKKYWYKG